MALEREKDTYKRNMLALMASEGKFAVIFKDDVLGVYDSYEDALKKGYEVAKLEPFLVKKISATDDLVYFSRDLKIECPTSH